MDFKDLKILCQLHPSIYQNVWPKRLESLNSSAFYQQIKRLSITKFIDGPRLNLVSYRSLTITPRVPPLVPGQSLHWGYPRHYRVNQTITIAPSPHFSKVFIMDRIREHISGKWSWCLKDITVTSSNLVSYRSLTITQGHRTVIPPRTWVRCIAPGAIGSFISMPAVVTGIRYAGIREVRWYHMIIVRNLRRISGLSLACPAWYCLWYPSHVLQALSCCFAV